MNPLFRHRYRLLLVAGLLAAAPARADVTLSYGARLTEARGKPVDGPVDLSVTFHADATTTTALVTLQINGVALSQGVAQFPLTLTDAEAQAAFPAADQATWIEITDVTHGKTYPRQRFGVVPYALKVPVDPKTLSFGSDGKLTVGPAGAPGANQFLTKDGGGALVWATPSMTNVGAVSLGAQAPLGLGTFTGAQETTLTGGLLAGDKGKTWFNTDIGQLRYWNGSSAQTLGTAGAGLQSLGGLTANDQLFAVDGAAGSLSWSHAADTHTLHVPLASKVDGPATATDNALARFDGTTGKLLQDSGVFVSDTGFLGVGTASPSQQLDVVGTAAASGAARVVLKLSDDTAAASGVGPGVNFVGKYDAVGNYTSFANVKGIKENGTDADQNGALVLTTRAFPGGMTERMRISAAGNVGIGTSSPGADLDITRATDTTLRVKSGGTATDATLRLDRYVQGNGRSVIQFQTAGVTDWYLGTFNYGSGVSSGSDLHISSTGQSASNPQVTITKPGDVGIGTTTPTAKLDVNGAIKATSIITTNASSSPGAGTSSERYGSGALAAGNFGVAFGNSASASGLTAVAVGYNAFASNVSGVALGGSASAGSSNTIAIGNAANASAGDALAIGSASTASGTASLAIGVNSQATAAGAIALGDQAVASTSNTFVAGSGTYPIDNVFFGKGQTSGTPTAWTLNGTGGSGNDVAGGALALAGGKSTGTAAGGAITLSTAPAGGVSGGAVNAPVERMRILGNGNVGIGTNNPTSPVHVVAPFGPGLVLQTASTELYPQVYAKDGGGADVIYTYGVKGGAPGPFTFSGTQSAHPYTLRTSNSERVRIDASGNVGIATSNPQSRLEVNGDLRLTRAQGGSDLIFHAEPSGEPVYWANYGATNSFGVRSNGTFHLGPMGLTSHGAEIQISAPGATSKIRRATNQWIDWGGSSELQLQSDRADAAGAVGMIFNQNTAMSNASAKLYEWREAGSAVMTIDHAGNLGVGTASPGYKLSVAASVNDTYAAQIANTGAGRGYGLKIASETVGLNVNDTFYVYNASPFLRTSGAAQDSYVETITNTGDRGWGLRVTSAATTNAQLLLLADSSAGSFAVTAAGNVGIGTTNPTSKLQVEAATAVVDVRDSAAAGAAVADPYLRFTTSDGTEIGWVGDGSPTGDMMALTADTGEVRLTALAAQPVSIRTSNTERLRVDTNGYVGVGTTGPTSPLHVAGAVATAVAAKTGNYTLTATDSVVTANAAGGAFTLTLPAASGATGRQYTLKKTDSSANAVTVAVTGGDTIDGAASYLLVRQYQFVTLTSSGAGWLVVGASPLGLGAATARTGSTIYQAATDLIVVVNGSHSGGPCGIYGYTDSSATPSTNVMIAATPQANNWTTGTFAVRKGDYWQAHTSSCTSSSVFTYDLR